MTVQQFFDDRTEQRKSKFLSHVKPHVLAIYEAKQQISLDEWKVMRLNSYEQQLLIPLLTNDAFAKMIENYIHNSGFRTSDQFHIPFTTYDDNLKHNLVHQLLARFTNLLGIENNDQNKT